MPRDSWKKLSRLFVDAALNDGAVIALDTAQQHYLTHVMRRAAGAQILLFNGRDGEWLATLETGKKSLVGRCVEQTRPQQPEPDLCLLFAPIKRDPLEYMAQKASELGVARVQPIITQHTVAPNLNLARLQSIAREGAEQCERLTLPMMQAALPLAEALTHHPTERPLLACLEGGAVQPIGSAIAAMTTAAASILVGPEGGFSAAEMELIRAHPAAVPVSLGPRILRADTAAIAALTVWQALRGDWR